MEQIIKRAQNCESKWSNLLLLHQVLGLGLEAELLHQATTIISVVNILLCSLALICPSEPCMW